MQLNSIPHSDLKRWVNTYKSSKYDEMETNNFIISLEKLENFMKYIHDQNTGLKKDNKPKIDGVRIYLVRGEEFEGGMASSFPSQKLNLCQTKTGLLPQISFVIVPTTQYAKDYYHDNSMKGGAKDQILNGFLTGIMPNGETSGLCPNNCGGSE